MFKKLIVLVLLLSLAGSGCIPEVTNIQKNPGDGAIQKPDWTNVAADIDRYDCSLAACGKHLIVFRFAKDKFSWRFLHNDTPSTVEVWARSLPKAVMVANAVYFDENFQPTGMLMAAGKTVNDRQYDLDLSGLINLSPDVRVIDTANEKIDLSKITEAAQNFPMLIKNGMPVKKFKDEHFARRTAIGTDTLGNVYLGFVPEDSITFIELAELLADINVKWDNVLNLDGGTSTGFAVNADDWTETKNSIVRVPNVIYAERK